MKSALIAVGAALVASILTLQFAGSDGLDLADIEQRIEAALADRAATANEEEVVGLRMISFTEEVEQDSWLRGTNRDGSPRPGPADDNKPLVSAENSVCFLTKVEFESMNGAEDRTTCDISIDEFTGWWELHAIQGEGTDSSVRCNARCIVWE